MAENVAVLWDSVDWSGEEPSEYDQVNRDYRAFAEIAASKGAEVYMANCRWYSDGVLEKAYTFLDGEWQKVEDVGVDVVFDKFDFEEDVKELKKAIAGDLPVLNHYRLEEIAADKLESYRKFPDFIPETRKATEENVREMLEEYGRVVVKPRSDWGGEGVNVMESFEEFEQEENQLVQRFVNSSKGVPGLEVDGVHDLRVLVLGGDPVAVQIRMPDSGWLSNVHQGGETFFVDKEEVPSEVFDIVDEVAAELSEFNPSFYSVDFIFDPEGDPWILEINSKPGLLFYGDEGLEESKRDVMEKVVSKLVDMAQD